MHTDFSFPSLTKYAGCSFLLLLLLFYRIHSSPAIIITECRVAAWQCSSATIKCSRATRAESSSAGVGSGLGPRSCLESHQSNSSAIQAAERNKKARAGGNKGLRLWEHKREFAVAAVVAAVVAVAVAVAVAAARVTRCSLAKLNAFVYVAEETQKRFFKNATRKCAAAITEADREYAHGDNGSIVSL
jgi:hypothetical protein